MSDYVRTSIRLPSAIHRAGVDRAHQQHRDFSGHVAYLIERDLAGNIDYRAMQARADAQLGLPAADSPPPAKRRRARQP